MKTSVVCQTPRKINFWSNFSQLKGIVWLRWEGPTQCFFLSAMLREEGSFIRWHCMLEEYDSCFPGKASLTWSYSGRGKRRADWDDKGATRKKLMAENSRRSVGRNLATDLMCLFSFDDAINRCAIYRQSFIFLLHNTDIFYLQMLTWYTTSTKLTMVNTISH